MHPGIQSRKLVVVYLDISKQIICFEENLCAAYFEA
jgi:hypothetical protein